VRRESKLDAKRPAFESVAPGRPAPKSSDERHDVPRAGIRNAKNLNAELPLCLQSLETSGLLFHLGRESALAAGAMRGALSGINREPDLAAHHRRFRHGRHGPTANDQVCDCVTVELAVLGIMSWLQSWRQLPGR
jgi:hypothetical protein